jgi:hypothetical protein
MRHCKKIFVSQLKFSKYRLNTVFVVKGENKTNFYRKQKQNKQTID